MGNKKGGSNPVHNCPQNKKIFGCSSGQRFSLSGMMVSSAYPNSWGCPREGTSVSFLFLKKHWRIKEKKTEKTGLGCLFFFFFPFQNQLSKVLLFNDQFKNYVNGVVFLEILVMVLPELPVEIKAYVSPLLLTTWPENMDSRTKLPGLCPGSPPFRIPSNLRCYWL